MKWEYEIAKAVSSDTLLQKLSKAGDDGWELASVFLDANGQYVAVLKRKSIAMDDPAIPQ